VATARRTDRTWRQVTIAIPYLWLFVFFLLPFAIILKISLADPIIAQPPFTPTFDAQGALSVTLDNFLFLLTDKLYALTYVKSVLLAMAATVSCLILGFPMAYGIARASPSTRSLLLLLIVLPFWISPHRSADSIHVHRFRDLYRPDVLVSAVHGITAVCDARTHGSGPC
jgi:putrescine transport system permease protein